MTAELIAQAAPPRAAAQAIHACPICGLSGAASEQARVRSNLRAFANETFAVWRCAGCRSLHARDEVDLAHYYAKYPFHTGAVDWRMRAMYDNLLRRLRWVGLTRDQSVLDYGCGGGHFVRHLNDRGYRAVGFDEYTAAQRRPELLDATYDFVLCQDVIEHVPDPKALVAKFDELLRPGGTLALGTPNASAIDLTRPEDFVHALHLPFHRHILSKAALVSLGDPLGWSLVRYFPSMYNNTLVPFINPRFMLYYLRCFDNNLDLGFEAPRFSARLLSPVAAFWAFLGWLFPPETDVMAVFRKPA